jgi:hypothetical protein
MRIHQLSPLQETTRAGLRVANGLRIRQLSPLRICICICLISDPYPISVEYPICIHIQKIITDIDTIKVLSVRI